MKQDFMTDYVRVLLIDDDHEEYLIVSAMVAEMRNSRFKLSWAQTYEAGIDAISRREHDVYLVDYLMGSHTGLDILKKAVEGGCRAPVIFLTAHGNYEVDLKAMMAGASDYLVKGEFTAPILERSIRYSIMRKHIEEELKQRTFELAETLEELRESREELKQLASQLLRAQEDERKRIAREIHDSIGSSLSAVKFCVESVAARISEIPEVGKAFQTLIRAMEQAIDDSRRIMTDLRPSLLDDFGIIATIRWFCKNYESIYTGIRVCLSIHIDESDIPENLKIIIFRIIQEAMNNSAKHSRAGSLSVELSCEGGYLLLRVGDDGVGFDQTAATFKKPGTNFGLASMRERAKLSGGEFKIESSIDTGTNIEVRWKIC